MKELILTAVIYFALFASAIWGGALGIAAAAAWLLGGLYMVCNSNSRGLLADVSFAATWPVYVLLER